MNKETLEYQRVQSKEAYIKMIRHGLVGNTILIDDGRRIKVSKDMLSDIFITDGHELVLDVVQDSHHFIIGMDMGTEESKTVTTEYVVIPKVSINVMIQLLKTDGIDSKHQVINILEEVIV